MRKLSRIVLVLVMVTLGLGCASASPSGWATLFPESGEVPGWSKSGKTRTFEASNLWQYMDGDAEKYLRAGVERTLTSDYRYQGKIDAVADIHVMGSSEGARKIFESEPAAGSQPLQMGDAGRLYRQSVSFRKGPCFVRLVAYQDRPQTAKALVELARAIERKLGQPEVK